MALALIIFFGVVSSALAAKSLSDGDELCAGRFGVAGPTAEDA
jgi:hypothetical protein